MQTHGASACSALTCRWIQFNLVLLFVCDCIIDALPPLLGAQGWTVLGVGAAVRALVALLGRARSQRGPRAQEPRCPLPYRQVIATNLRGFYGAWREHFNALRYYFVFTWYIGFFQFATAAVAWTTLDRSALKPWPSSMLEPDPATCARGAPTSTGSGVQPCVCVAWV